MGIEQIKDEYKISTTLSSHGINNPKLLEDIDDHLDKTLTIYLSNEEQQRQTVHNEWICCLYMALNDTRKGSKSDLVDAINNIIDSCKPDKDEK